MALITPRNSMREEYREINNHLGLENINFSFFDRFDHLLESINAHHYS